MEEDYKPIKEKNSITGGFYTHLQNNLLVNITVMDLSAQQYATLDETVQFPGNLVELNLCNNKFVEVPAIVLNLGKLKKLDISKNEIQYFDKTPNFCHTLEQLDISKNKLVRPPYWIWREQPSQLTRVNLSYNTDITKLLTTSYLEDILQFKTLLVEVNLYYCNLRNMFLDLLGTLSNAKVINLGHNGYNYHGSNEVGEVPCMGLNQCLYIERLNLNNTQILNVNTSISMLTNLSEIDLGNNMLCGLPNEFCSLTNLETCILSYNKLLYLPMDMIKLTKLKILCIDNNELCMLPEKLIEQTTLRVLDLYDNHLYEILDDCSQLEELDLAQNYLDEPNDEEYLKKKEKLRMFHENRSDGSKPEIIKPESEHSITDLDDEEYDQSVLNDSALLYEETSKHDGRCSSPEDWDSDHYWIPYDITFPKPQQTWMHFIEQKMAEGNFCPIDAHVLSIGEKVANDKKINPQIEVECIGQFDDYSSDDS